MNYEGIFTVKSLRKNCADYAFQNRGHAKFFAKLIDRKNAVLDDYFVSQKDTSGKAMTVDRSIADIQYDECVINEQATYQKYINDIQYTAEEIGNTERHAPIWGKPELEGKMICYKYGIKLEVIESRSNGLDEPIRNEYGIGEKRITIVKYNEHFVPLLSSISQDVTRDQEVSKSVVYGTPLNRQLPIKRKGDGQNEEVGVAKKPRYDNQNVIGSELKKSKKFIEDLFDKQSDNVQKIIEQLYGYDPVQRVINPFQTNLENHFVHYGNPCGFFSMFYKKLSNPNNLPSLQDFATELAKLWIKLLSNNAIELQLVEISGTYNSLSKLSAYVLKGPSSATFKLLITGLANRAKGKDFNAQEIANIYNALSKWVNNDNVGEFKPLITQLATQAKDKDFNAQAIANIYNALSKWVNNDNVGEFKTLITQLADQAKDKDFNTQHIANIYNALSKWVNNDNVGEFKTLITQLAGQAKDKDFNTQEIAMIYNALSKWVTNNNINLFKPLITQLADQAKDKDFNTQEIGRVDRWNFPTSLSQNCA
ncbi:hypothetical protein [Wolbachia endosymbiont (group E) of Neria commutata]|uniref:hypothetical protein n=1 Tax=Wolbachia endosymbiont (group E) of Neria commutata TaxID=3066149 RepID=UPI003132A527